MATKPRAKAAAKKAPTAKAVKKAKAPAKKTAAKAEAPARAAEAVPSLRSLRDEIDRVLEEFDKGWSRWPTPGRLFDLEPFFEPFRRMEPIWAGKQPTADVVETDTEFRVNAEMPGIDEKDIEVTVADGILTIKGEKSEEKEERKKDYHVSERRFGSYRRSFALPTTADIDKVQATMKNGVLSVFLPKAAEAKATSRKVPIGKS